MSEKSPFAKQLETFNRDANEAWINDITDDKEGVGVRAGTPAHYQQLEEADAYYQHMEQLDQDDRSSYDRGLDRRESGDIEDNHDPLVDEAFTMNEKFDSDKAAKEAVDQAAIEAKFVANPELRQMNLIAQQIAKLRAAPADSDPDKATRQMNRLDDLQDSLTDKLADYEASADYDESIADLIIDRTAPKASPEKEHKFEGKVINDVAFDPAVKKAKENEEREEREAAEIEAYDVKDVEDEKAAVTPEERERAHGEAIEEVRRNMTPSEIAAERAAAEIDAMSEYESREGKPYEVASEEKEETKAKDDLEKWKAERGPVAKMLERPLGALTRFSGRFANLRRRRETETDDDGERSKIRRSTMIGLGIVAVGAIGMTYVMLKHGHHPHPQGSGSATAGDPSAAMDSEYASRRAGHGFTPADLNAMSDYDPKRAAAKGAYGLDQLPLSPDATKVSPGEGWLETMKQAGIADPETQARILHNDEVMEQLRKMGLAYEAPELGGWGINMPVGGKMPTEALELITGAAK